MLRDAAMNVERLLKEFWAFARSCRIPSRDAGIIPFKPYGTQKYLARAIITALAEGRHEILILKPRQIGASTLLQIFTAFWLLKHRGLPGAFIADSDTRKEKLRYAFSQILNSLPPRWSYPQRVNNRVMVAWANGSRLGYETAGLRRNPHLGKSQGLAYLHATEVAGWGDPEGVASLRASFSQRHPARCYLWESTAQGFNFFEEMWRQFSRGVMLEAIFVPWWRHEEYQRPASSVEYQTYWDGRLTTDERAWQEQITAQWQVTLTPEQWAWYRYYLSEEASSQTDMHTNFPTLPHHAFQSTGAGFVDESVVFRLRDELVHAPVAHHYRYAFGETIEQSELHQVAEVRTAELTVWEAPRDGARYVVAADPSFGASEQSDMACCQVWRCEPRRLIQVAEFAAPDMTLSQFAWVAMHLAGTYWRHPGQSYFILELSGPGHGVWQEIQRLFNYGYGSARHAELQNVLTNIQHYIYRRPDHMSAGGVWQWQTTHRTKKIIMEKLRDSLLNRTLIIRSKALIEEISGLQRLGDSVGAKSKSLYDDRAITAALAIESWQEQVVPILSMMPPMQEEGAEPVVIPPAHERCVKDFFDRLMVTE
jgi:hypothetical protein